MYRTSNVDDVSSSILSHCGLLPVNEQIPTIHVVLRIVVSDLIR